MIGDDVAEAQTVVERRHALDRGREIANFKLKIAK
jgi:hypothetical protein